MKACTFLLSMYILFLCLASGLEAIKNTPKTETVCCQNCGYVIKQQKAPTTKQENKGSSKKMCNPFESCKTCISFWSVSLSGSLNPVSSFFAKLVVSNEEATKHLALDFWQPPKLS